MWDRKWVPLGDNKQAAATAESIAQLFHGEEERLSELTAGRGKQLLEALGISLADLPCGPWLLMKIRAYR